MTRRLFLLAMLVAAVGTAALPVAQDSQRVTITHRRPLEQAAQLFEARYGVVVTYEDAPLGYPGDVVESPVADAATVATISDLKPLHLEFELPRQADWGQAGQLFERVLAAHQVASGVGRYRVVQSERVIHLIPTESRDLSGAWVAVDPILSRAISFPSEERSAADLVALVLERVNAVPGSGRVALGMAPAGALWRHRTLLGSRNQPARDVLDALFEELKWRFTWRMYYPVTGWKPTPPNMRPTPLFSGTYTFNITVPGLAPDSAASVIEEQR